MELLVSRKGGAVIVSHDSCFDGISDHIYRVEKGGIYLAEC